MALPEDCRPRLEASYFFRLYRAPAQEGQPHQSAAQQQHAGGQGDRAGQNTIGAGGRGVDEGEIAGIKRWDLRQVHIYLIRSPDYLHYKWNIIINYLATRGPFRARRNREK